MFHKCLVSVSKCLGGVIKCSVTVNKCLVNVCMFGRRHFDKSPYKVGAVLVI